MNVELPLVVGVPGVMSCCEIAAQLSNLENTFGSKQRAKGQARRVMVY